MMKKVLVLISYTNNANHWFPRMLSNKGFNVETTAKKKDIGNNESYWRTLIFEAMIGWKSFKSSKNVIVVGWNWAPAIYYALFDRLLFFFKRKRPERILALHTILEFQSKKTIIYWKIIFRIVAGNKRLYIAVNSIEEKKYYSSFYKMHESQIVVIPDCYDLEQRKDKIKEFSKGNGSIFCGGASFRDWNTMFSVATLLPEMKFVCIARKESFSFTNEIPKNVSMFFDTTSDFFSLKIKQSSIVIMPVTQNVACGLLVIIQSALYHKPIIATNTPGIRNYIQNNKDGLLVEMANSKLLAESIIRLYEDIEMQQLLSDNLNEKIEKFSPERYIDQLLSFISE